MKITGKGPNKAIELEGPENRLHRTVEEDNALQDMTDRKNEDFIYVY